VGVSVRHPGQLFLRENAKTLPRCKVIWKSLSRPARTKLPSKLPPGCGIRFPPGSIHLGPQSMLDPQECFETNVGRTVRLLEAARQAGVRKVVLSSSTAVYGNPDHFPTDEETPLRPLSPYALSKQVNELYGRLYTQTFKLPVPPCVISTYMDHGQRPILPMRRLFRFHPAGGARARQLRSTVTANKAAILSLSRI